MCGNLRKRSSDYSAGSQIHGQGGSLGMADRQLIARAGIQTFAISHRGGCAISEVSALTVDLASSRMNKRDAFLKNAY
jgi:hypothetical protein